MAPPTRQFLSRMSVLHRRHCKAIIPQATPNRSFNRPTSPDDTIFRQKRLNRLGEGLRLGCVNGHLDHRAAAVMVSYVTRNPAQEGRRGRCSRRWFGSTGHGLSLRAAIGCSHRYPIPSLGPPQAARGVAGDDNSDASLCKGFGTVRIKSRSAFKLTTGPLDCDPQDGKCRLNPTRAQALSGRTAMRNLQFSSNPNLVRDTA